MNPSKIRDLRFWKKWEEGGAVSESAKKLLAELLMHLNYDAGVNGSAFADNSYGRILISYEKSSLYQRLFRARSAGNWLSMS